MDEIGYDCHQATDVSQTKTMQPSDPFDWWSWILRAKEARRQVTSAEEDAG